MKKVLMSFFAATLFSAQVFAQNISAIEARDAALAMTGGGTVSSLELLTDSVSGPVYQIVFANEAGQFEVTVNAATGDVLRLTSVQPSAPAANAAPASASGADGRHITRQGIDLTALGITPAPPPGFRIFRPRNPPVSRANAVEIGYLFLASQGFNYATFRRHSGTDRNYGRWAWELYFMDGWTQIELYVDMHSGDVVLFDIDR